MATPELIHSTALVAPGARIAAGVRIGAFSVVGPEVTLETRAELGHHVVLEGRVVLGPGARVGHGAILGGEPQDLKFKAGTPSGVRIGAGTVIREFATIHRATRPEGWTEIGADCLIMAGSHIAHDCRVGDGVIVINYAGITGHCEIEEQATIGGFAGVVPFTRVGAFAYVGGYSKVTADVPPYMLVDGAPAAIHGVNVIGLRRAGMPATDRRGLQQAHRLLCRSGLSPKAAVDRIRAELGHQGPVARLVDFIAGSRRGICAAATPRRDRITSLVYSGHRGERLVPPDGPPDDAERG